jgi:hypothetical protein
MRAGYSDAAAASLFVQRFALRARRASRWRTLKTRSSLTSGWRTARNPPPNAYRPPLVRFRFVLGRDESLLPRGPRVFLITRVIRRAKCPLRVALL